MSKSTKRVVLKPQIWSSGDSSGVSVRSRVNYRECQRNHAANTGGYALDGCIEFMPSGARGTDRALVCAACGCHRNFHRKEVVSQVDSESSSEYSATTT